MKHTLKVLMLFGLIHLGACKNDSKVNPVTSPSEPPSKVQVEGLIVSSQPLENKLMLNGNIMANEEVQLQPEIAGRITNIYFTEGEFVSKGKLLVKLNDADLRAQLKKAEVALELAEQDESRKRQLLDIKAVSTEEYDQSATMLKSAQADIDLIKAQIDKTEIRAPFSGIIGLRMISNGAFVSAGQNIAELQQVQPMKLDFAVPERHSSKVGLKTKVNFTVEGIRDTFDAKIFAIDPAIDLSNRSFRVRATTPNAKNVLKRGAFASVNIILEELDDAIMIPASAVVPEIRGQKTLIIRNGKVTYQLIEIGMRTDRQVHVIEGLEKGDTLITAGLIQLREGMAVELKKQGNS